MAFRWWIVGVFVLGALGNAARAGSCLDRPWLFIEGQDTRGKFRGAVDFWQTSAPLDSFTRNVDYADDVKVLGDRKLSWVFQGRIRDGQISGQLQYRDFVAEAENLKRTHADPHFLPFTGSIAFDKDCVGRATFQITGLQWEETWRGGNGPSPVYPFTGFQRTRQATMADFNAFEHWSLRKLFKTFHALPEVAAYKDNADFQRGIDYAITDKTDFDFYRANPQRIRIRAKVIDAITLAEEKPRADAYGPTLREKARLADEKIWGKFYHPLAKTLAGDIPKGGSWQSNYDGALWQGMTLAAYYFKYKKTGDPGALVRIGELLEGLLILQEISPDETQFARTVRPKTGDYSNPRWHPGTGHHADLDWLDGGNNDMQKGLLIGLTYGYYALCLPAKEDHQCQRIRRNAGLLADKVRVKTISDNTILSTWLAAWVTQNDPKVSQAYAFQAKLYWRTAKSILEKVAQEVILYGQGDWSGLNLHLVARLVTEVLQKECPLQVSRPESVNESFQRTVRYYTEASEKMRYANWLVGGAGWLRDSEPRRQDAIWRLREIPIPKIQASVDHTLQPDFSVSLIPSHPWKADWERNNRIKDFRYKPFFEVGFSGWILKDDAKSYRFDSRAVETSPADYFFLYWFARYLDVIDENE